MKVVIQCAGTKHRDAGKLRTRSGADVLFVATPSLCESASSGPILARPDDLCDEGGITWRDVLSRYNERGTNPDNLLMAANLYAPNKPFHNLYGDLADGIGWDNFFVLSAGWGIIHASFLTPDYNITFSTQVRRERPWVWRNAKDRLHPWSDFNHLAAAHVDQDEPIHFFGSNDYRPIFCALTSDIPGKKIVHFKGKLTRYPGVDYEEYVGPQNQNWQYPAARDFLMRQHTKGY